MSQVTIQAKFNKQTKDSKKELLQFYVENESKTNPIFTELTGSPVFISLNNGEVELSALFAKSSNDGKKAILDFEIKGDKSAAITFEFYKMAGKPVELKIVESQKTLEDYNEEGHEGIKYQTDKNGVVSLPDSDPNQTTIDEINEAQQQAAAGSEPKEVEEDGEEL
ncbi:MAG: hypothetical protein ABS894_00935 [Aerococcus urinaeequi]